jgi:hypothetical protein
LNTAQDLFLNVPVVSHPWLFWDFVKLHGNQDNSFLPAKACNSFKTGGKNFYGIVVFPARPEKSALLESALPTPVQKNIFSYTVNTDHAGLVQQPDKIVVRYAHTIYPYSFGHLFRY